MGPAPAPAAHPLQREGLLLVLLEPIAAQGHFGACVSTPKSGLGGGSAGREVRAGRCGQGAP